MGHPTPIGNLCGRARGKIARCLLALLPLLHLGCSARSLPDDVALAAALAGAVHVVPNVAYGQSAGQRLDLYLLKTPLPPPVLVYFHGGGWTGHTKEEMNVEILPYLAMGFAVANVEYRLLAEAPAPAAVADACCALRWVIRNGTDYYLDPTRIVLAGGSAGGHLALMAGMAPSGLFDQSCQPDSGDPPSQVRAILNWGGPGDVTALVDGPQARDFARQWLEAEKRSPAELRERARQLSPRSYVRRDGPPVLTIHGDADSLISYGQAVSLHAELEQAGVRNRLYTIAGGGHGGFDPEAIAGAFAAIREFLIECGLPPESPKSLEAGRMSLD